MCAQTVREALQKVAGVNKVKVNLSKKKVLVAIADELEVSKVNYSMTAITDNLSNLSPEDATTQMGAFLKEHGELEMILPVAIGVFITTQFQLRGANALLVNLLVASLGRQLFIQLKKEQPSAVIESNNSHNSHNSNSTGEEIGVM